MSVKEQVNQIVFDQLHPVDGPEDLASHHNIRDDLGADSLDLLEMLMEFEEEFGVDAHENAAEEWKTLGDIYEFFEDRTKETAKDIQKRAMEGE